MDSRFTPAAFAFLCACTLHGTALRAQQAGAAEYRIDYWNTENGLPQNSVNQIRQSGDGYLWLATLGGVARFDGTSFFSISSGDFAGLRSDRVRAVVEDRAGRVWMATEDGLSRYERGRVTTFGLADGMPASTVNSLVVDATGAVWFGTANGALGRVDAAGVHVVQPPLGVFGNYVEDLITDDAGALWVSARSGVWRFASTAAGATPVQLLPEVPARHNIRRLVPDRGPEQGVWVTTDSGLVHLTPTTVRTISFARLPNFDATRIRAVAVTAPNVLWFGGGKGELWRFRADSNVLTRIDELRAQSIVALAADREGSLWVGDRITGLARLRPTLFRAYSKSDGLPQDNVVGTFADSRGRVWVAARCSGASVLDRPGSSTFRLLRREEIGECITTFAEDTSGAIWIGGNTLARWRDGASSHFDSTSGLPPGPVRSLFRDRSGTLWIGTIGGLASWDGRRFTLRGAAGGAMARNIRTIFQARDGSMWLGTERGLLHLVGDRFDRYTTANGLPNDFVRAIADDSSGNMWLATYGGGLALLRGGKFTALTTRDGLYDNYLSSIAADAHGNLWFSSNRGVFRLRLREIQEYAATRAGRLHSVAYGRSDGLPSTEANGGFQSGVARSADGRLWYPTLAGVAVVDPARAQTSVPPPATIERVVVDGKPLDPASALRLGPDVSTVEISYAGLSLSAPNAVTFRYRLDGWDRGWIDAGTRRAVTYSRLPHGDYHFRVMAANREGTWGAETTTDTITILPHFWQTWWFRSLAGLGVIGLMFGAYRARLAQVRAAARRREAMILESITDGFFALDRDGRFTYVNHTAERLLGRPARELLAQNLWDSFPAARGTIAEREIRRAQSERTPVVFETPDAPVRGTWLEMHAYPTDDGMSVYFADITDRKRAEDELRNQKEEIEAQAEELAQQTEELSRQNEILEENVRLKDEVERISRHDLRTPLNTIISLSQLVREDALLAPEHETSLKLIEQAGHRVLHMASLTLDLFKMEQGTYTLDARPVDVRAIVARTLLDLQPLVRTRDVTCEVRGPDDAFALGDELLAQAMVGNIVKNAVEASPRGGRILIEIASGDRIVVRVSNAGEIPPDVRSRFFEKYATSGKRGGTGLGAYSARLMARTQGGDISFTSSASTGTTITIDLPRSEAPHVQPQDAGASGASAPAVDGTWALRRILIVDDDASNRAILRRYLAYGAWTVDEAENGPLAVKAALEHAYDVVFMDIEMPEMDGAEATELIRADERVSGSGHRARIIAFSSHDDATTHERAFRAGCDRYITKPATRQTIVDAVLGYATIPATVATLDPAVRDLVPAFVERKRGEVAELIAALDARDSANTRRIAHRLRGSFSVYGFAEASAVCASLEEAAQAGRLDAVADKQARTLYDHLSAIDRAAATNGTLNRAP